MILAYLPPFIRNLISQPDGFLINSASGVSFKVYLLDGNNIIMNKIKPKRIGESELWECRVPTKILAISKKIIIHKEDD